MTPGGEATYHTVVSTSEASFLVSWTAHVTALLAALAAGCRALTGADDLRIQSDLAPAETNATDGGTTVTSEGRTTTSPEGSGKDDLWGAT